MEDFERMLQDIKKLHPDTQTKLSLMERIEKRTMKKQRCRKQALRISAGMLAAAAICSFGLLQEDSDTALHVVAKEIDGINEELQDVQAQYENNRISEKEFTDSAKQLLKTRQDKIEEMEKIDPNAAITIKYINKNKAVLYDSEGNERGAFEGSESYDTEIRTEGDQILIHVKDKSGNEILSGKTSSN